MCNKFTHSELKGGMFHCPKCHHATHARTSRYLSENTKERYHQCTNIHCSCTFVTMESVERYIVSSARTATQDGQRAGA